MNSRKERKIIKLLSELEAILKSEPEKTIEFDNYTEIYRLKESIEYEISKLIQCDYEE